MNDQLPSFQLPPVIETALSVQFKLLPDFSNAHLGLFWADIRSDFPTLSDSDLIQPQVELFGEQLVRRPRLPNFRLARAEGAARLQMTNPTGQSMIQLQNGRLVLNWSRLEDGIYPRWHQVLPQFINLVERFSSFLKTQNLGPIEPIQWEVTYVNHLEKGRDWESSKDWPALLPGLLGTLPKQSAQQLEYVEGKWRFLLGDNQGRLHVECFHGFTGTDAMSREVVVLQFTARGPIRADNVSLESALDIGHVAIVKTFAEVTGSQAHIKWGRTS